MRADGRKELIALTDGYRESTESWASARCRPAWDARSGPRGRDGALGFWGALREVFPTTREQRHPGAKKALAEIWNAEDKRVTAFGRQHEERSNAGTGG